MYWLKLDDVTIPVKLMLAEWFKYLKYLNCLGCKNCALKWCESGQFPLAVTLCFGLIDHPDVTVSLHQKRSQPWGCWNKRIKGTHFRSLSLCSLKPRRMRRYFAATKRTHPRSQPLLLLPPSHPWNSWLSGGNGNNILHKSSFPTGHQCCLIAPS